jgi:hypothetical protein
VAGHRYAACSAPRHDRSFPCASALAASFGPCIVGTSWTVEVSDWDAADARLEAAGLRLSAAFTGWILFANSATLIRPANREHPGRCASSSRSIRRARQRSRRGGVSRGKSEKGRMSQAKTGKDTKTHGEDPSVAQEQWLSRMFSSGHTPQVAIAIAIGAILAASALWMLPTGYAAQSLRSLHDHDDATQAATGTPGSVWSDEYAKVDANDEPARHRLVLEQVGKRNMPDTWDNWVTVPVTGRWGTVAEFEVSPHGLRIGTASDWVEVPLDGPHFAAAAEILGLGLATAWMVEKTYLLAEKSGGAIHYFAAAEIAHAMGHAKWKNNAPDGLRMKGPEFFRQRSALLRDWLLEHRIGADRLVSGYFKTVVPPIDGLTRRQGLEMVGGHTDEGERVQSLSGGFHHRSFFDYSHNIRLAKRTIRVNGRTMTLHQFFNNVRYAREFVFRRTRVPDRAYPYPEDLAAWMEKNGHLKYPLEARFSETKAKRKMAPTSPTHRRRGAGSRQAVGK